MKLELTIGPTFKSEQELMAYVNTPEFNKPFDEYRAQVHKLCEEGLSEEDLRLYRDWHAGTYQPYEEGQPKQSEELHGAIMQSISLGLG